MHTAQATLPAPATNGQGHDLAFLDDLLLALRRLDARLESAVQDAQALFGSEAHADPYRGLYIGDEDVERLLRRPAGSPLFGPNGSDAPDSRAAPPSKTSRLYWLEQTYALSGFDLDLLLLALAPEIDRRYERIYAYLQDHVSRRRPAVDLALDLLCGDARARIQRRVHFDPHAPLIRHGLIHLLSDQDGSASSLLAKALYADEQIVRFLLHQDAPDSRIAPFCRLVTPADMSADGRIQPGEDGALSRLASQARRHERPLRLYFHGPDGFGKRQTAMTIAAEAEALLLIADLRLMARAGTELEQSLRLVFRYAHLYHTMLYLDGLDALPGSESLDAYRQLLAHLAESRGVVILAGTQPWANVTGQALGVLTVEFALPDFVERRACWSARLAEAGCSLPPGELDLLADRFRLTPLQIAEAVLVAQQRAAQIAKEDTAQPTLSLAGLLSAARAQSGHELRALARKVDPHYTWNDIVLPEDALLQLREICQRAAHRQHVLGEWGFERKLSQGKGVNVLFAGPSGAGKTMAAEILANELSLDLYKIDLSGVVSKYIGETEKNLERIFAAAENSNAILFFDEADALFGKRSEVSDAHDRYANIEISYLLQRMEEYSGIAILATNLRQNLDDAFIRRVAFTIHFPFPDAEHRRRIWERIWPAETPLSGDVDLAFLAEHYKLSGGNIKNVALAAAFLAAADHRPVSMQHLRQAIRREYQKMGKVFSSADLADLLGTDSQQGRE